jgi:C1A family cysteine protease
MAVTDEFINYTGGIFVDETGRTVQDHDISVVGWGEEDGVKYWIGRNSWGSYWGIKGFFKIIRGENNMGIEEGCSYAVPLDTWSNNKKTIPAQPILNKLIEVIRKSIINKTLLLKLFDILSLSIFK